ncbi:MAG: hypothetical protein WBP46_02240 [Thiolinea sp.]
MHWFRSHWYYWYTGKKKVAVLSMALSFLLLSLIFNGLFSFSVWAVLLALLLDAVGFVVIAIYFISLRSFIPEALLTQTDSLVVHYFVLPICIAFVLSRFVTFLVAKALG